MPKVDSVDAQTAKSSDGGLGEKKPSQEARLAERTVARPLTMPAGGSTEAGRQAGDIAKLRVPGVTASSEDNIHIISVSARGSVKHEYIPTAKPPPAGPPGRRAQTGPSASGTEGEAGLWEQLTSGDDRSK